MTHYNPKGRTKRPHCAPTARTMIFRGETQKYELLQKFETELTGRGETQKYEELQKSLYPIVSRKSSVYATAELFPLLGFPKRTPGVVCKVIVTYGVMCMCEFSLLLGWTVFKSLGTLSNT